MNQAQCTQYGEKELVAVKIENYQVNEMNTCAIDTLINSCYRLTFEP